MDGPREQFLAGSRIAVDENAGVGIGDELGLSQQILHAGTARDDPVAPLAARGVARTGIVARQLERRRDELQQLLAVERLGEEPENTALRGRNGIRNSAVRGQDQHRQRRMLAMDGVEELQPIDAGHA